MQLDIVSTSDSVLTIPAVSAVVVGMLADGAFETWTGLSVVRPCIREWWSGACTMCRRMRYSARTQA